MKIIRTIILAFLVMSFAFADIWHVSPDSISTIQAAIDTAASGDTILVKNAHQNAGPVEIVDKQIFLWSSSYVNNPSGYNFTSGTALYDSVSTRPLLMLNNANGSEVRGFYLDKNVWRNGGGVIVDNSDNVTIDGLYLNGNTFTVNNSSLGLYNTSFYGLDTSGTLVSISSSVVEIVNAIWKNNSLGVLLETGSGSELAANNLAVYNNDCSDKMYAIGSSLAFFNYITSYGNTTVLPAWVLSSTWLNIENSILENAPPLDIAQCEINYSAVPGNYPGTGNFSGEPRVDTSGTYPALLDVSPCISAANPDTSDIPRTDILGNQRPDPDWAPPDMGAFESSRHLLMNEDHCLLITSGGDDVWGNGSEDYPFATIQGAVDYASDNDTLLILPGEYNAFTVIEDKSLTISSSYLLTGDSSYVDSVILRPDPALATPIFLFRDIDSLELSGITLENGMGREFYNNYSFGGAIYCEDSDLRLKNMSIKNSFADFSGGAVYGLNSSLLFNGVDLINNTAYLGGAISLSSSTAKLANVEIRNNVASSGGGIYAESSSGIVGYYVTLVDNSACNDSLSQRLLKPSAISEYGGAVMGDNSVVRFHNSLFANNLAVNKGAAIAQRGGELYLVQSTLSDNTVIADSSATIMIDKPSETVIVLNSVLSNASEVEFEINETDLELTASLLEGGEAAILLWGDDNFLSTQNLLDADPLFDANYGLTDSSPCLNEGIVLYTIDDHYLINYSGADFTGSAPDLGYTGASPEITFDLLEIQTSVEPAPETFTILNAYPNPFNPSTFLEFNLEFHGETKLLIYDISGKRIAELLNKEMQPGYYRLNFMANSLPSGIYVASLVQDKKVLANQKLLLVK